MSLFAAIFFGGSLSSEELLKLGLDSHSRPHFRPLALAALRARRAPAGKGGRVRVRHSRRPDRKSRQFHPAPVVSGPNSPQRRPFVWIWPDARGVGAGGDSFGSVAGRAVLCQSETHAGVEFVSNENGEYVCVLVVVLLSL